MGAVHDKIRELVANSDLSDLERYAIYRFFYKYGNSIVSDGSYDLLEKSLRDRFPEEGICKRSYDDDPVPYDVLEKIGLSRESILKIVYGQKRQSFEGDWEVFNKYFAVETSKSITAFFEWHEAMPWLMGMRGKKLNLSLKIDGNYTQSLYLPSERNPDVLEYRATYSRGRDKDASPLDLTAGCSHVMPQRLRIPGMDYCILKAEIYCDPEFIPAFNEKYGTELITPRGVGLSMARTNSYEDIDYAFLRYNAFNLNWKSSLSESYLALYNQRIDTVPFYTLTLDRNATAEQVKETIFNKMLNLYGYATANNMPSDGIVVQLDDTIAAGDLATEGMYDGGIIALKTDFWKPDTLTSEVVHVEILQQQERANCIAIVRPTQTSSGKTITRVNCFNPDILISAGIKPGKMIQFVYKNETTVDLVY